MSTNSKKIEIKEFEGRKAAELLHPDRVYDFTSIDCRYDALSTGDTFNVEEFKTYNDPEHPRTHDGVDGKEYSNYQVDYIKLYEVFKKAKNSWRRPLLTCFFKDYEVVWDLYAAPWESTAKWVHGNKEGVDFGEENEWDLQAYLEFDKKKGMVSMEPIPDDLWERVRKEVEKEHPGIYNDIDKN